MKNNLMIILVSLMTSSVYANQFSEQVKVTGLSCDNYRLNISLRSLENDYVLHLAKNLDGALQAFELDDSHCRALAKHLTPLFAGKIYLAEFLTLDIPGKKTVHHAGSDSSCRTKCDDGYDEEVNVRMTRIETKLEGYRFFRVN
jgi:hypothetical protein